jgi:dihydroneopterin aldolase
MVQVQLRNLLFRAFHGIHEEEKILGNEYSVDATLQFYEKNEIIEHINDTIDYSKVYEIIKRRMQIPTPLLETVVMHAGNDIHHHFPELKTISISIKKMSLPVEGMQGFAEVSWHKEF